MVTLASRYNRRREKTFEISFRIYLVRLAEKEQVDHDGPGDLGRDLAA